MAAPAFTPLLGVDFLWVETEHSPITFAMRAIVPATRALPAAVFAHLLAIMLWTAKRVMGQARQV